MNTAYFKHYQIKNTLGEGGFGQVFEAWDSKLCRIVALKRLKHLGGSMLQEARMGAQLVHAAFVKVHAVEDDEDSQAIVMELVRGQTLKQLLQTGPLPAEQSIDIVLQIAQAMQEAHAKGLIHGDLKPSNLILDPNGKVRILDFGLASQADPGATTSLMQINSQGTISYMAPERLTGATGAAQSDVYALGMILYELLNGTRPFAELNGLALVAAHMKTSSDQWPWPASAPPALRELVLAMTASQPEQRPGSAQVVMQCKQCLQAVLQPYCESLSVLSMPQLAVPATPVTEAGLRRRPWRLVALALLTCVLFGLWQAQPYWPQIKKMLTPYSAEWEMKQGLAAMALYNRPGMLQTASQHFTTVLAHDSTNARAVAGLSIVFSYRFRFEGRDVALKEKALASAQQALKLAPDLALSQLAYARAVHNNRQPELAMAAVQRAKQLEPNNLLAWQTEANLLQMAKKSEQALIVINEGLKLFPQDCLLLQYKGVVYLRQEKFQEAEQVLRLSIAYQPDAIDPYTFLAMALRRQDKNSEAMQILQQGLQIRPNALSFAMVGRLRAQQGDFVGAVSALERAVSPIEGAPEFFQHWMELANYLMQVPGRTADALLAYKQSQKLLEDELKTNPDDAKNLATLAIVHAKLGNPSQAHAFATRALALAPVDKEVQNLAALASASISKRPTELFDDLNARQKRELSRSY